MAVLDIKFADSYAIEVRKRERGFDVFQHPHASAARLAAESVDLLAA